MKKRLKKAYTVMQNYVPKVGLILELVLVFICCMIILNHFDKTKLLSDTTPIGSDIIYHYANTKIMHDSTFPGFMGWNMYTGSGSPYTVYYPPFMYYIIALFGFIFPLNITFKVFMILGLVLLPLGVYISLRLLKIPRPGPILGCIVSILIVIHSEHFAFGGNIKSVMSGEFAHSWAILFLTIYVGLLWKGIQEKKYIIPNSIILTIISMTHPVSFVGALALPIFFIFENKENLKYIMYHYGLTFLLTGIWFFRMFLYNKYIRIYSGLSIGDTNLGSFGWPISTINVLIPKIILPLYIIAIMILILALIKPKQTPSQVSFIAWGLSLQIFLFAFKPIGWSIRFIPQVYLFLVLIVAVAIGLFFIPINSTNKSWYNRLKLQLQKRNILLGVNILLIIITTILVFNTVHELQLYNSYRGTSKYVFQGHEGNGNWPKMEPLFNFIDENITDDTRVVCTTTQAESLYLYNEKKSITALFTYSSTSSKRGYFQNIKLSSSVSSKEVHAFREKLNLFNAQWLIVNKSQSAAIKKSKEFKLFGTTKENYIYQVTSNQTGYAVPLEYKPVAIISKDKKEYEDYTADWFKSYTQKIRFVTHLTKVTKKDKERFLFNVSNITNGYIVDTNSGSNLTLKREYPLCNATATLYPTRIELQTNCINQPVLIKVAYFVKWKVTGADKIYMVSPSFMLIYPEKERVTLYYGNTLIDYIGYCMVILGLIIIISSLFFKKKLSYCDSRITGILKRIQKYIPQLSQGVFCFIIILITISLLLYMPNTQYKLQNRIFIESDYLKGVSLFYLQDYEGALLQFEKVIASPKNYLYRDAYYYAAISAYNLKKYDLITRYGFKYINDKGDTELIAHFRYTYARSLAERNNTKTFLHEIYMLRSTHPKSVWREEIEDYFIEWQKTNEYNESDIR